MKAVKIISIGIFALAVGYTVVSHIQIPLNFLNEREVLLIFQVQEKQPCRSLTIVSSIPCSGDSSLKALAQNKNNFVIVNKTGDSTRAPKYFRNDENISVIDSVDYLDYGLGVDYFKLQKGSSLHLALNKLNKEFHLGYDLTQLSDEVLPINFYGNANHFSITYCLSDTLKKGTTVLLGYVGEKGPLPAMNNDTIDLVSSAMGEMYNTILMANVIGSFLEKKMIVRQGDLSSIILCLMILGFNFVIVTTNVTNWRFKMIQVGQILLAFLTTFLVLSKSYYLLNYNAMVISILGVGELLFWMQWIFRHNAKANPSF